MSSNTREDGGALNIYKAGLIAIFILFGTKKILAARYTVFFTTVVNNSIEHENIMAFICRFSYIIML